MSLVDRILRVGRRAHSVAIFWSYRLSGGFPPPASSPCALVCSSVAAFLKAIFVSAVTQSRPVGHAPFESKIGRVEKWQNHSCGKVQAFQSMFRQSGVIRCKTIFAPPSLGRASWTMFTGLGNWRGEEVLPGSTQQRYTMGTNWRTTKAVYPQDTKNDDLTCQYTTGQRHAS